MAIIRWILGRIIFIVDLFFRPRLHKHPEKIQTQYNADAKSLTLYQYAVCPFCVKVRWALRRLGVDLETKDAKRNAEFAQELVVGGGQLKVPCLRIQKENGEVEWMYESSDIIDFLAKRYSKES